jgi:rod shape-determining protein MreD
MPFESPTAAIAERVSPRVIALSLLVGFIFELLPWRDMRGVPDLVALGVLFWSVHQPRRVSLGAGFCCGLLMDAANGVLLGQHALVYAVIAFAGNALSRRILGFAVWPQTLHVMVLMVLAQALTLAIRMAAGGTFPGWMFFAGGIISGLLWPLAKLVLSMAENARASDQAPTI